MSLIDFINGNSPLEELSRTVFMQLRLYYPWNKYYLKKMNKQQSHPYMIEARKYFSENASRVDQVMKLLCDDISKDTFNKLIHMRQFYGLNDIPQYNYFNQYFPKDIIKYTDNEVFVDGGRLLAILL